MKILKLSGDDTRVVVELDADDVQRLSQFCSMAARATAEGSLPEAWRHRDDLRQLAESYAALFEVAGMVAGYGCEVGSIVDYRRDAMVRDFPFTREGQRMAHDAKQVDEMLDGIDGLQGAA